MRARWCLGVLALGAGGCLYEEDPAFGRGGTDGMAGDPSTSEGVGPGDTADPGSGSGSGPGSGPGSGSTGTTSVGSGSAETTTGPETPGDPSCEIDCPWWDDAWPYRLRLEVSIEGMSGIAEGVPVLIELDADAAGGAFLESDGSDLRFVSPDGATMFPHDVELWAPQQGSVLWLEMPQLEDGQGSAYLYFGAEQADIEMPQGWADRFVGVWHLSGLEDSGPGKHHAQSGGGSATSGRFAGGWRFEGGGEHLDAGMGAALQLPGDLSVSLWLRTDALQDRHPLVARAGAGGGPPHNTVYQLELDTMGRPALRWETGNGVPTVVSAPDDIAVELGAWHHLAAVRDATAKTVTFYLDGASSPPIPFSDLPQGGDETETWIGAAPGDAGGFVGILDEVRIGDVALPADFIEAQALAASPGTVQLGEVETP